MNFYFIVYVLVSIMCITGAFYINFSSGRQTQAAFLSIGFLAISVFFGLRWFKNGNIIPSEYAHAYPPIVNTCPDYMSLIKVNDVYVCVDPVGVSQHNGTNGVDKWTSPDQIDAKYTFDLKLSLTGGDRLTALCDECKAKGVTWEGVWNGSVCMTNEPPKP